MARYIYPGATGEDGRSESVVQVSSLVCSAGSFLYERGEIMLGMGLVEEPMVVLIQIETKSPSMSKRVSSTTN